MDPLLFSIITIGIMVVINMGLRLFPLLFTKGGQVPKWLDYLGKVLPYAIMPILIVYCVKSTKWGQINETIPTVCGISATAVAHIWKKNTILSLIIGISVYMFLIRAL